MNASFFTRFKAFLFDYILIFAYIVLLIVISVFIFPPVQQLFIGSVVFAQFFGFLIITLPVSLYFIICDSKLVGQTWGKKKMGIRVVNNRGEAISVPQMIFRVVLKFLPWELSHYLVYRLMYLGDEPFPLIYTVIGCVIYALMIAYILTAIFTKKKQSLYDIIAKTYVIKDK